MALFSRIYSWQRYWCPRDVLPEFTPAGYLAVPDLGDEDESVGRLVTFQGIEHVPCLVLLGDPGSGKSTWLTSEREIVAERARGRGDAVLMENLENCGSFSQLSKRIFGHEDFVAWQRGRHRLHLFLDSLDQCWSQSPSALPGLIRELQDCPLERLCLRIVCRSAEWPRSLEDKLEELYEEEDTPGKVQICRLAPLTQEDVREAVEGEAVPDPEAFMSEIKARRLVPFAIRPKTLGYLIRARCSQGELPRNQVELYETGCKLLCEESNQARRDAGLAGNLSTEERLAVASRLAALSLFCNYRLIYTGSLERLGPQRALDLESIAQGIERVGSRDLGVTIDVVRESILTGLFSIRGEETFGWSHQTDAEFLAARYIVRNNLPLGQIQNLLGLSESTEAKVPSQLRQVASWLAVMRDDVLDLCLKCDPEELLLRDLENPHEADRQSLRSRVTERLLQLLDYGVLLDYNLFRDDFERLNHPGLDEQLRPYIGDRARNFVVRRVAIEIAGANKVSSLQDVIAEVALDPRDHYWVRVPAARALRTIADPQTKEMMKPLARGEAGEDPDDELKGYALMALWPEHISAEELFGMLTVPKNSDLYGSYRGSFLDHALLNRMRVEHIGAALRWVQRLPRRSGLDGALRRLADAIMARGYEDVDAPGVLDEFACTTISRLESYDYVLPADTETNENILFRDHNKRLALVRRVVELLCVRETKVLLATSYVRSLLGADDWRTLLNMLERSEGAGQREIYARLISEFFSPEDRGQLDVLFQAMQSNPELKEAFRRNLGPIDLDSPQAESMKRTYEEVERYESEKIARAKHRELTAQSFKERLGQIGHMSIKAFSRLIADVLGWMKDSSPFDPLGVTSAGRYLWDIADEETQSRLLAACQGYVIRSGPRVLDEAVAGYAALSLMHEKSPEQLEVLSSEDWARWAEVLLTLLPEVESDTRTALLKRAYASDPGATISSALQVLDRENKDPGGYPFVLTLLDEIWDKQIENALARKMFDHTLRPGCVEQLLKRLLTQGCSIAKTYAKATLQGYLPPAGQRHDLIVFCAKVLFLHAEDAGWLAVWPAISRNRLFGKAVMERIASEARSNGDEALSLLSEDKLRDLYIWMSQEYPPTKEDRSSRMTRRGKQMWVEALRESVLRNLCDRETVSAVETLQRLINDLPEQADSLIWQLHLTQERVLAATWELWRPEDLLALFADQNKRLVVNADQLLAVIVESLQRFQDKLHNYSGLLEGLWNTYDSDKGRKKGQKKQDELVHEPKDELHLSNIIAEHLKDELQDRGVVVNREVAIRRGEFTDIHVETSVPTERQPGHILLKVIIEVKGCWNGELGTAMETQLVDTYLKNNLCRHGLYVVGWFHCKRWNEKDYRKKKPNRKVASMSVYDAQDWLDQQASELSQKCGLNIRAVVLDAALPGPRKNGAKQQHHK